MGPKEIIIIVAVILLLFGAKKIPTLAKSLGQAKGEFEKGIKAGKDKDDKPKKEEEKKPEELD